MRSSKSSIQMIPCFALAALVSMLLLLPLPVSSASYTWNNVAINGGGFVPGLVYSPVQQGLLYARTDVGGFYRWNSSTSAWSPLIDMFGHAQGNYFGGESIAPDPVNPNIVYAAAGSSGPGAILSSTDQGATWTVNPVSFAIKGNDDGRNAGERLAVDPNLNSILYFGSRSDGLWVSTNSAASWSQVTSFPVTGDSDYGLSWVIFPPPSGGYGHPSGSASPTIYVGVSAMSSGNSNVYYSSNAGASWSLVKGGPSNMVTPHASLGSDGKLWIVYDSGGYGPSAITAGQVWRLDTSTITNASPTWANVTPSNGPCSTCGGYGGVSVDANNPQHALASSLDWWWPGDEILSTSNGGTSWTAIAGGSGTAASSACTYNDNGAGWAEGCPAVAGVGGVGWAACVAIDPFNGSNGVYPSSGNAPGGGMWSSANIQGSTVNWAFTDHGIEEMVPIYMPPAAEGGILLSCMGDVGGMRHTSLTQSPASMYCNPQFSNTNCLDFAEANPSIVVRAGNANATTSSDVAYSTNNGQSWTPWGSAPSDYTTNNNMGSVAVAADGSRVVVAPYSGKGTPAYASSLGGSWTTCTGLPSGAYVAADRSNASLFYATSPANWVYGGNVTIYESTDGGKSFSSVNTIPVTWSDANGNGQWVMPRPVFGQSGEFWVSTYNALYRFTNGGTSVATISSVYEPMGPVGFGKAASGQSHPAVYLAGTVNGAFGFWRNDDGVGTAWTPILDTNHQYGGGSGWMEGDESVYGRCYMSAGGRGIVYCDPISGTPTITPSPTPSRTPSPSPTRSASPSATSSCTASPSPTRSASPSATFTASVSPSATPTATATATRTSSPTASPTHSASPTPSATAEPTGTAAQSSATSTLSATAAATGSPSSSATPSPTGTMSRTLSPSGTASPTGSPTRSATLAPSPTWTNPPTGSTPTDTPTLSATATASCTPSISPTLSMTPSRTSTGTGTATPSPSATAVQSSPTATESITPVASGTGTATLTATATPSPSGTQEPSSTRTSTGSPTATGTPSQSASPTLTGTPVPSATAEPSATSSATVAPGGLRLLRVVPVPNPQHGPDVILYVQVQGRADSIKVRLYSQALNEAASFTAPGGSGWVQVKGHVPSLPAGAYFVVARGLSGGQGSTAKAVTLLWLP